jgi:hypothetical protein
MVYLDVDHTEQLKTMHFSVWFLSLGCFQFSVSQSPNKPHHLRRGITQGLYDLVVCTSASVALFIQKHDVCFCAGRLGGVLYDFDLGRFEGGEYLSIAATLSMFETHDVAMRIGEGVVGKVKSWDLHSRFPGFDEFAVSGQARALYVVPKLLLTKLCSGYVVPKKDL